MFFEPHTYTWPDGTKITWTREGDVVTALIVPKTQAAKTPYFMPQEFRPAGPTQIVIIHGTAFGAPGFVYVSFAGNNQTNPAAANQVLFAPQGPPPYTSITAQYIGTPVASGTSATQLIIPTDAEQAIIDELSPTYTIGTGIPEPTPSLFARVLTTGGSERDLVTDKPWLTIEVFATRESKAQEAATDILARLQLAARKGRMGGETLYTLDVAGLPQNYPLPSVPTHARYVLTIAPALRRRVNYL